jgi:hypothetical protein
VRILGESTDYSRQAQAAAVELRAPEAKPLEREPAPVGGVTPTKNAPLAGSEPHRRGELKRYTASPRDVAAQSWSTTCAIAAGHGPLDHQLAAKHRHQFFGRFQLNRARAPWNFCHSSRISLTKVPAFVNMADARDTLFGRLELMIRKNSLFKARSDFSTLSQVASSLLCAVVAGWLASGASAELLIYEPFDYPAGERVLGQTNPSTGTPWRLAAASTAGGDTTAINTDSGNLTPPPGLSPAVGNLAKITGVGNLSGAANRLALPAGTGSNPPATDEVEYFYSLLLRIDDVSNSTTGIGGFFIGFNNLGDTDSTPNPGSVAARLQVRQDPGDTSKYNLGIVRQRAATAADVDWTGPMTPGETLFLVASSRLVPGLQNDVSSLWINPPRSSYRDASPPPATIFDDSTGTGTDLGVFSIILRQSPAPFLTLDELRVGTTWRDVTIPEPTTLGLLAIGAVSLLLRRSRRL